MDRFPLPHPWWRTALTVALMAGAYAAGGWANAKIGLGILVEIVQGGFSSNLPGNLQENWFYAILVLLLGLGAWIGNLGWIAFLVGLPFPRSPTRRVWFRLVVLGGQLVFAPFGFAQTEWYLWVVTTILLFSAVPWRTPAGSAA